MSKLKLKVTLANVKVGAAQGSLINPLQVKVKEALAKINILGKWWGPKGQPVSRFYIDLDKSKFPPEMYNRKWSPYVDTNGKTVVVSTDDLKLNNFDITEGKYEGSFYVKFSNAAGCIDPELSVYITKYGRGDDIRSVAEGFKKECQYIVDLINKVREENKPKPSSQIEELQKMINSLNDDSEDEDS